VNQLDFVRRRRSTFGLFAGSKMPLSFSLTYASPEVIAAYDAGETQVTVSGAADMWSLGVIAYELLTGRRAFPKECHLDEVRAQVIGAKPLPWEWDDLSKRKVGCPTDALTSDADTPTPLDLYNAWNFLV
jgi:serine/threonine protein kinase